MDMFQIEGARPLQGKVRVSGSKNACLPLLTAALLSDEATIIENVPDLRDIREMIKLIQHLGARVTFSKNKLLIEPASICLDNVPYEIMRKMRASFYAMGPMLARLGRARISLPGGCAIGDRPVDLHLRGFKALGVQLARSAGYVHARHHGLTGARLSLLGSNGTSVGATCNVMMAAVFAKGQTIIDDAAKEPEVVELAQFLISMGAKIDGVGTSTLRIDGVEKLSGTRWKVQPDRIEAITYAIAGLITHGDVTLENIRKDNMESSLEALETWGADMTWESETSLRVRRDRNKKRTLQLVTEPYPGFPTDIQAPFAALLAMTPGNSSIRETIYHERFMYVPEMNRLGTRITLAERGKAVIQGVPALEGAAVMASDLRAGAALICAALAAHGKSQIRRIYHVERGYEDIEGKLRGLGARIERLPEHASDPGLEMVVFPDEEVSSDAIPVEQNPARAIDT